MPLQTPLHPWHVAHGARMVDFAGWDMPIQYTTITDEHQAVRGQGGVFDISHMGRLVFAGPEAAGFLQHLFTNDIPSMKPGQVRYGLVCNESGGILDDVLVYRLEPGWLMVVNASNRDKVLTWVQAQKGSREVTITDRTLEWGMIAIQGPHSLPQDPARWGLSTNPASLRYYYAAGGPAAAEGAIQIVSRTGYTGEDGFELIVPAPRLLEVVETIFREAPHLKPCGLGARDTLRLEAAMPLYGHELSEEIDPLQAGLGWAVKLDKGEFLGRQAILERQKASRAVRIGLELAGKRIAREGAAVLEGGRQVGHVTSGTFSPSLGRAIAMAYVEPGSAEPGRSLAVDVRGRAEEARVVKLPFYRRAAGG